MLTLLLSGYGVAAPAPAKVFGRAGASSVRRSDASASSSRRSSATGRSSARGTVETEREPEG